MGLQKNCLVSEGTTKRCPALENWFPGSREKFGEAAHETHPTAKLQSRNTELESRASRDSGTSFKDHKMVSRSAKVVCGSTKLLRRRMRILARCTWKFANPGTETLPDPHSKPSWQGPQVGSRSPRKMRKRNFQPSEETIFAKQTRARQSTCGKVNKRSLKNVMT